MSPKFIVSPQFIVTIDGPSAAGKGTVARGVARELGIFYLDTGAMYRAAALCALRSNTNIEETDKLGALLSESKITFSVESKIFLNGEDISAEIRKPEMAQYASDIAKIPIVREQMKSRQREIAAEHGAIVAEGRDMGTNVFSDAEFKFYLLASIDERARRRWRELVENDNHIELEEVKKQMALRDEQDSTRDLSPLHPAPDAVIINTTAIPASDVIQTIVEAVTGA